MSQVCKARYLNMATCGRPGFCSQQT